MLKLKYISWAEEYIFLIVFVARKHKNKQHRHRHKHKHKHKPLKMQCNAFQFQARSSLIAAVTPYQWLLLLSITQCWSPFVDGFLEAPVYLLWETSWEWESNLWTRPGLAPHVTLAFDTEVAGYKANLLDCHKHQVTQQQRYKLTKCVC